MTWQFKLYFFSLFYSTKYSCARQNDVNATRRSAGNSSFLPGSCVSVWTPTSNQLIANSSFVWFIRRNYIASQILSSKIISWNFICNAKGIFKSWECYCSRPFAGNKHARSHCQFSCQARTFTSFCRAHDVCFHLCNMCFSSIYVQIL